MITNPIYGGASAYGKTGLIDSYDGVRSRSRSRRKSREGWLALQPGKHEGYLDWERSETIRRMVSDNIPSSRHHGAAKHGDALLAGLLRCRRCGRKLTLRYSGTKPNIPRYTCNRGWLDRAASPSADYGSTTPSRRLPAKCSSPARLRRRWRQTGKWPSNVTKYATPWAGTSK
jgi:hypothetical protein